MGLSGKIDGPGQPGPYIFYQNNQRDTYGYSLLSCRGFNPKSARSAPVFRWTWGLKMIFQTVHFAMVGKGDISRLSFLWVPNPQCESPAQSPEGTEAPMCQGMLASDSLGKCNRNGLAPEGDRTFWRHPKSPLTVDIL